MRIITYPPKVIGKGCQGLWQVTATFADGRTHSKNYEAFTMCEATRKYLQEFGRINGKVNATFLKKTIDKHI